MGLTTSDDILSDRLAQNVERCDSRTGRCFVFKSLYPSKLVVKNRFKTYLPKEQKVVVMIWPNSASLHQWLRE